MQWFTTWGTLNKDRQRSLSCTQPWLTKWPPPPLHLEYLSFSTRKCSCTLLVRPLSYIWKKQNDFAKASVNNPWNRNMKWLQVTVLKLCSGSKVVLPSSQERGWGHLHLRKLRLCDGDFWRDIERPFSLPQTTDCLSYMKATDLCHEGVNLDKWHDLFL